MIFFFFNQITLNSQFSTVLGLTVNTAIVNPLSGNSQCGSDEEAIQTKFVFFEVLKC